MLINELLKQLMDLEKQQSEIKQKKKDLLSKARAEKVLELCLSDLVKELQTQTKCSEYNIKINPIYIPNSLWGNIEDAKTFLIKNNTGLGIRIENIGYYQFNISLKDTTISNNSKLVDHIIFDEKTHTMVVPNKIIPQIMINLDITNSNMEKPFFKEAVIKCVERREKQQILK